MMRHNNKGFSLVEIIIVVAIMTVLIGVTGYGISLSSGKAADECARKLASCMQHARTATMGKYSTTITIKKDADGIWAEEVVTTANADGTENTENPIGTKTKIGDAKVSITFNDADFSEIQFIFNRGTGGLSSYADQAEVWFTVSKASTTKKVVIVPITGKITVQ